MELSPDKSAPQSGKMRTRDKSAPKSGKMRTRELSRDKSAPQSGKMRTRELSRDKSVPKSGKMCTRDKSVPQSGKLRTRELSPDKSAPQSGKMRTRELSPDKGAPQSGKMRTRELSPDICAPLPGKLKKLGLLPIGSDMAPQQMVQKMNKVIDESEKYNLPKPRRSGRNHQTSEPSIGAEGNLEDMGPDDFQKILDNVDNIDEEEAERARRQRVVEEHFEKIRGMSMEEFREHYSTVKPILRGLFEGSGGENSDRVQFYMEGPKGQRKLRELNVSVPFGNDQAEFLILDLFDFFIPDPLKRDKWSIFISFVLLPEALIWIYAKANGMSYKDSENEMRFGPAIVYETDLL